MSEIERLGIKVDFDDTGAARAVVSFTNQFRNATASINRDVSRIKSGLASASGGAASSLSQITVAINGVGRAAQTNRGLLQGFMGGIAAGAVTAIARSVGQLSQSLTHASDTFALAEAKLRLATDGFGSFERANRDVIAISNETRTRLEDTTQLYVKVAASAKQMGLDQGKVTAVVTNFNKALKVSGATGAEASSSILQFSQALASGRLQGDEFRSLAENAPRFMGLLADSLGVPRGELKKLASEGQITSEKLVKALSDPKFVKKLEEEFGKLPVTFADVQTAGANMVTRLVGAFAGGLGVQDSLAVLLAKMNAFVDQLVPKFQAFGQQVRQVFATFQPIFQAIGGTVGPILTAFASNLGAVAKAALVAAAGFTVFKVATAAGGIATAVTQVIALERALGATSAMGAIFSASMKSVQGAIRGVTLALASNPITAIAVAITVAAVALYEFSDKIKISSNGLATLADYGNELLSRLGPAFTAIGEIASDVFSSIGEFADKFLTPIGLLWGAVTDDMEFSFTGFVRFFARSIDFVIKIFSTAVGLLSSAWANFPSMLQHYVAVAVNGAAALFEKFVNSMIGGFNSISSYLGLGEIGKVNLGRVKDSGVTVGKVLRQGIDAGAWGKRGPVEAWTDGVQAGAERRARANAKKKPAAEPTAASPTTPAAASGSDGKKDSDGKKADETDKYAKEIENLRNQKAKLVFTERELTVAEALGRAGLKEDPKLIGAKADEIRKLVNAVEDGKAVKTLADHIAELKRQTVELGISQRDAFIAQEARSAGITKELEELSKLNPELAKYIAQLKEAAGVKFDADQKKEAGAETRQFTDRFSDQATDQKARRMEMNGDYAGAENLRINTELARTIQAIRDAKLQNAQIDDVALIAQATALANGEKQLAHQERMVSMADQLSGFMVDLFSDPMATMKRFLQMLIQGLIKAVLQSILLKQNLSSAGGGGGIGGILTSVLGSIFGGGRAVGGTVSAGKSYLVGERGPEIIRMGKAGRVFPNHRITGGGGGGLTLAPTYNIQMSGNAQQDAMTLAQMKQQQADQNRTIRSQAAMRGWQ